MAISAVRSRRYQSNGKIVSDRKYFITMAVTLLIGFLINAIEVVFFADFFASLNFGIFVGVYFGCFIIGMLLNIFSMNAVVSFIGYLLIVAPMGGFFALLLPGADVVVVRSAFLATALIGIIFSIIAIVYPEFFTKFYMVISVCLLTACILQMCVVVTGYAFGQWYEWLVTIALACYVGIDISFAASRPRTLDCAVDSACGLYLDIVNLFFHLLYLLAKARK